MRVFYAGKCRKANPKARGRKAELLRALVSSLFNCEAEQRVPPVRAKG
jgi:hypothetical protein